MKLKNFAIWLLALVPAFAAAQSNLDFEKFKLTDERIFVSSMAVSPDGKTVALGSTRENPIVLIDIETREEVRRIPVSSYNAGPKVSWSKNGTYLLLEEQTYFNWNPNKDKQLQYQIINAGTGKLVRKIEKAHSAVISQDETLLATLIGDEVVFWTLPDGKRSHSFVVENATNAMTLSADGGIVFVSHKPEKGDLEAIPSIRNDKKAKKEALKFRQVVSYFDAKSGEKLQTVHEIFDLVFSFSLSADGEKLFVYSKPHTRYNPTAAGTQGYIQQININTADPGRAMFMSLVAEPDYKESSDNRFFGIVSTGTATGMKSSPNLQIFSLEDGNSLAMFDLSQRLGDSFKNKDYNDGRVYFTFLPGNNRVLLSYGNNLFLWNLNL